MTTQNSEGKLLYFAPNLLSASINGHSSSEVSFKMLHNKEIQHRFYSLDSWIFHPTQLRKRLIWLVYCRKKSCDCKVMDEILKFKRNLNSPKNARDHYRM